MDQGREAVFVLRSEHALDLDANPTIMTSSNDPAYIERDQPASQRWTPGGQAQKRLDAVLDQLRLGKTVNQATAHIGVTAAANEKWRARSPVYAADVDRIGARRNAKRPTYAFDPEFRERYFGFSTPAHMQRALDLINGLQGGQIGLILLLPEHGKSTRVTECSKIASVSGAEGLKAGLWSRR